MLVQRLSLFQFSSAKNIAKKTFDRFNSKYTANL